MGFRGILQIIADLIKSLYKENFEHIFIINSFRCFCIYILLAVQLICIGSFEFDCGLTLVDDIEFLVLLQNIFCSMGACFIECIGFLSSSRYSLFGAIRAVFSEISIAILNTFFYIVVMEASNGLD